MSDKLIDMGYKNAMELRHLRYFVTLAEELHFGRAARRLHIVQPTLSNQIFRLEEELGVQLFYRTKRSVELTDAGRAFLREARHTLEHSARAIREARRVAVGEAGHLEIGFVGSAIVGIISLVTGSFKERFPDVELAPHELNTSEQVVALIAGRIQVGFLRVPASFSDEDIEIQSFIQEPLIAVLPEAHPLSELSQVPLAALAKEPFITPAQAREPGYYEQLFNVCEHSGFVPEVAQEVTELQVGLRLVAAGVGLSLVPASVRDLKTTGVVYRKLTEPPPRIELSIAWLRDNKHPALLTFLDVCEEISQQSTVP